MTKEDILAQQPGRELDLLVAKELFYVSDPSYDWRPSEDISTAWRDVEAEIDKRNLRSAYCQALQVVLHNKKDYVTMFDYVHASPADRCKAALLAVDQHT